MGKIYLVRHGQASLGANNYDQLSALGVKQSFRLGEYFKERGIFLEAAYCGSLSRQQGTLSQILQGLEEPKINCTTIAALNEYDSHELIKSVHHGNIPNPSTPDGYKEFFGLLRLGLLQWMTNSVSPNNLPSFADFQEGIIQALKNVQSSHKGAVLIVSSGGPISTALAYLLEASDSARIELNLRLRNSSISELSFNANALSVISFNGLEHLSEPQYKDWITYA